MGGTARIPGCRDRGWRGEADGGSGVGGAAGRQDQDTSRKARLEGCAGEGAEKDLATEQSAEARTSRMPLRGGTPPLLRATSELREAAHSCMHSTGSPMKGLLHSSHCFLRHLGIIYDHRVH